MINETWKQLKEEIIQCDDSKTAVGILLDKIEYLLGEVERLTAELDGYKEDVLVFIDYSKERPCTLCSRPNESPYMCVECRDKNNWEYCRVEVYHEQE